MKYHPNSNSRRRFINTLCCRSSLNHYLHGVPPETQEYDNNGHLLSDYLTLYRENGLTVLPTVQTKNHNGRKGKIVAHLGQKSNTGFSLLMFYS